MLPQELLLPLFELSSSLLPQLLHACLHSLFYLLLFFLHLSIDSPLHFSDLSLRIGYQLALCCLYLLVPLLFEVHELLLNVFTEPAQQLLAQFLDKWVVRVPLDDLFEHSLLSLVSLEHKRLLVFKELLLFSLPKSYLRFSSLYIRLSLNAIKCKLLLTL